LTAEFQGDIFLKIRQHLTTYSGMETVYVGLPALMTNHLIMVALCNRADHYIFMLWFVLLSFFSSFFSSPNLSGRRLDVYHTLAHGVALVRI